MPDERFIEADAKLHGGYGVEHWSVVIDNDRIMPGGAHTVCVELAYHDGTDDHLSYSWWVPEHAREIAAALLHYAEIAERANAA